MICIIAGNYDEAATWASGQNLDSNEWFYPNDEHDLMQRVNFHVIVIGTAGQNVPVTWFNKLYEFARKRGKIGRQNTGRFVTH